MQLIFRVILLVDIKTKHQLLTHPFGIERRSGIGFQQIQKHFHMMNKKEPTVVCTAADWTVACLSTYVIPLGCNIWIKSHACALLLFTISMWNRVERSISSFAPFECGDARSILQLVTCSVQQFGITSQFVMSAWNKISNQRQQQQQPNQTIFGVAYSRIQLGIISTFICLFLSPFDCCCCL